MIGGDKIERLQDAAGEADAEEIRVLRNAAADNLKQYEFEATAARKRDLDAARAGLDEAIKRRSVTSAGACGTDHLPELLGRQSETLLKR